MKNKKSSLLMSLLLMFIVFLPMLSFAGNPPSFDPGDEGEDILLESDLTLTRSDIFATTALIINYALTFLGTFSLIIIIYAGFKWMWARGNEEEITQAKDMLKGAFIGLILILGAYAISYFVFTSLTEIITSQQIET